MFRQIRIQGLRLGISWLCREHREFEVSWDDLGESRFMVNNWGMVGHDG